jgi:hypothetical protein
LVQDLKSHYTESWPAGIFSKTINQYKKESAPYPKTVRSHFVFARFNVAALTLAEIAQLPRRVV